jgi:rod shape determining protein RodA
MQNSFIKHIDKPTFVLYLIFIVSGWICIYEASYQSAQNSIFDINYRSGLQFIWVCISLAAAVVTLLIHSRTYITLAYFIYGGIILLLIATIFLAPNIKGSHSWLVLGPFSVQPAEFAKFATALALAKLFGGYDFNHKSLVRKTLLVSTLIFLPMLIILLQQETGSALVFIVFIAVLYREGLSGFLLFIGVLLIVVFVVTIMFSNTVLFGVNSSLGRFIAINLITIIAIILKCRCDTRNNGVKAKFLFPIFISLYILPVLFHIFILKIDFVPVALFCSSAFVIYLIISYFQKWKKEYLFLAVFVIGFVGYSYSVEYVFEDVLQTHQQSRIRVLFGLEYDPQGAEWNVNQAKIAVGSGSFWGKGFLKGTQTKLKFVPEQDTDFIFCTIGEELGFAGSLAVVLLFAVFIFRLTNLAEQQTSTFARVYGYCVAGIFLFHFLINIGMVLGIMPVIGIPLPFFSYGGSSLLAFTILLFIFLGMDSAKHVNKN